MLIIDAKGNILRTQGRGLKNWQNFADVEYGWLITCFHHEKNGNQASVIQQEFGLPTADDFFIIQLHFW